MAILTQDMANFLDEWSSLGGPVARKYNLPVSVMLACASVESNWGKGKIYAGSLNPFSLQKWPHTPKPSAYKTYWAETVVQTDPKIVRKAPFACAMDREDAVRQWCEWILFYGDADGPPGNQNPKAKPQANKAAIERRIKLLGMRNNPEEFAGHLYWVGFGEEKYKNLYKQRLKDYSMRSFDF